MKEQKDQKINKPNQLLAQFNILKQKLDQRGTLIKELSNQLQRERAVRFQMMEEFKRHQSNILSRLHKLEEINIQYIKDYLMLKKIMQIDEFETIQSIFDCPSEHFFHKKYQQFKHSSIGYQLPQNQSFRSQQQSKFVSNCLGQMKTFLVQKQPNYEKIISVFNEQRRKKFKEVKGLQDYKQNKQDQKFIDALKEKINRLNQLISTLDNSNMIEVLNLRRQIQSDIAKLDPQKGELALQNSQQELQLFQKIVGEVVMINQDSEGLEEIGEQILLGQFASLKQNLIQQSEIFGSEFVNNTINKVSKFDEETRMRSLKNEMYMQFIESNRQTQIHSSQLVCIQEEEGIQSKEYVSKKVQIHKQEWTSEQLQKQYEVNQSQHQKSKRERVYIQKSKNEQNQQQDSKSLHQQQECQKDPYQQRIKKHNKNVKNIQSSKVNAAFENTMTKSFFQQQQKSRDTLIAKQSSELQQHQKVINKLITFIKKEFKQHRMQDIEGDDPEQLMGYYFRVNQRKHIEFQQEMEELQKQKEHVEQENHHLKEQKVHLEQIKETLQKEICQMKEEKMSSQKVLFEQKQKAHIIEVENQNLKIKLQLQKLQIVALSEIYQGIKQNAKGFHALTARTESLVKLSLETVFNTCLNKLLPEDLIQRLQNIIELIKINMRLKSDIAYELNINDYLEREEKKIKKKFSQKISEDIVPFMNSDIIYLMSQNHHLLGGKINILQNNDDKDQDKQSKKEKSQKSRSFAEDLQAMAIQILQNSLQKAQNAPLQIQNCQRPQNAYVQQQSIPKIEISKQKLADEIALAALIPLISMIRRKDEQNMIYQSQQGTENKVENEKGLDQTFINVMIQKIREMRVTKILYDEDLKQMYEKYKQALDCLERAERLNRDYQMKYQEFLKDLKQKGARNSPQVLEDKLFYMERVIDTQNGLLENQRKQYQQTIMKQVQRSQQLAKDVIKSIRLERKQTLR